MKPHQPTQVFSNIEINSVLICGKQDTGAEVNTMSLNVYDQFNQKLNGNLELKPMVMSKWLVIQNRLSRLWVG